mmetsp:Transcript_14799/g.20600  ORF Transcript_14799/g.20600 Transcript_14799/m.20600 type:complete len:384 (+) Transcript_14799:73-1224(+)
MRFRLSFIAIIFACLAKSLQTQNSNWDLSSHNIPNSSLGHEAKRREVKILGSQLRGKDTNLLKRRAATKRGDQQRSIKINSGKASGKNYDGPLNPLFALNSGTAKPNVSAISFLQTESYVLQGDKIEPKTLSNSNESMIPREASNLVSDPRVKGRKAETQMKMEPRLYEKSDKFLHGKTEVVNPAKASAHVISDADMIASGIKVKTLEMLSLYDVFVNVYRQLPETNGQAKLVALVCVIVLMIGKLGCICLCFQRWREKDKEASLRQAARLVCRGSSFNAVDPQKVAAILGTILDQDDPENSNNNVKKETKATPNPCNEHHPEGTITWAMHYSENGAPCFYNHKTGEKRWSVPNDILGLENVDEPNFALPSGCNLANDSDDDI